MEKEFIPYELALRMKNLGFDKPCIGYYTSPTGLLLQQPTGGNGEFVYYAPLYQQAFRWFREKYKLYCYPNPTGSWRYTGIYRGEDEKGKHWVGSLRDISGIILFFNSFEEAELACLTKLIEIVEKELIN